MKKNYITTCSILLSSILIFSGCKKETANTTFVQEASASSAEDLHSNNCRLEYFNWGTAFTWKFHYNQQGLADKWLIDYGDGNLDVIKMLYDKNNRLTKAHDLYFGVLYSYVFTYTGNRLTKLSWTNAANEGGETLYTYNNNGQIIKEEDTVNDLHAEMFYDGLGNKIRSDYYAGSELYFSDNYTFRIPMKNPCLTVSGIELAFPFVGTGLWDKRWFTSNKGVTYDNGNPIVLYDYDPSKTIVKLTEGRYPSVIRYYDRLLQVPDTYNFKYNNCGDCDITGADLSAGNNNNKSNKIFLPLHIGTAKSIRVQIQKLRKQHSK